MSANWSFYSFDSRRFEELFGGGGDAEAEALVEILTDEEFFDFDDPDVAEEVARRVIADGLSYEDADVEEQDVLDCIPSAVFHGSEALGEYVRARPESPQGLHVNVVGELLKRAAGRVEVKLLSLFDGGRRYGGAPSEYCEYVIFSPSEVGDLLAEVRRVVDLDVKWSHPDFPREVETELVGPLRKASDAGRGLAAFYP